MNKKELVNALYDEFDEMESKKKLATIVDSVFSHIAADLMNGVNCKIQDFGTFKVEWSEKQYTNILKFIPDKYLKGNF